SKIAKGQSVDFTVSKGEKKSGITLPDYSGMSVESVRSNLEANKLKLGTISQKASSQPSGTVIGQSPTAGSEAKEGEAVNIVVSIGEATSPTTSTTTPTSPTQGTTKTSPEQILKPE
ncbi:PASTA domain-containing protein, partial [Anaerovibrio sp.]